MIPSMERQIVCLRIPKLEVALARQEYPSLRTRPLAIASTHTSRAMIREASPEAEESGVFPGLPVDQAKQRCPSLHLLPPKPSRIAHIHRALLSAITPVAPVWEPAGPGQVFLDLSGTSRLFGAASDTTMRVERDVSRRTGLHAVAGIGTNKLVAQMATTVLTPPQLCDVLPGSEQAFLLPLPVSAFPGLHGPQGAALRTILTDLNLYAVQDLVDVTMEALEPVFGRWAPRLYQWARGMDPSPVLPPDRVPTLTQSHIFEPDTIELPCLLGGLSRLTDTLCRELRRQHHECSRLTLTVHYSDQSIVQRSRPLTTPTPWEVEMFPFLRHFFLQCFPRRIRVRRLTVRANSFRPPPQQLSLFDASGEGQVPMPPPAHRLAMALDRLHARFGTTIIRRGRSYPAKPNRRIS